MINSLSPVPASTRAVRAGQSLPTVPPLPAVLIDDALLREAGKLLVEAAWYRIAGHLHGAAVLEESAKVFAELAIHPACRGSEASRDC